VPLLTVSSSVIAVVHLGAPLVGKIGAPLISNFTVVRTQMGILKRNRETGHYMLYNLHGPLTRYETYLPGRQILTPLSDVKKVVIGYFGRREVVLHVLQMQARCHM
jgi:hypothetical protein